MMRADFIIDVNEADFEYQVLAFSQDTPVVVDFWADWCAPCRVLSPILEKLAKEGQGDFRLAKLNVDQNQNLSKRYKITSIPAVKIFMQGKIVGEFTGARPEVQVREFLRASIPNQGDLTLAKGLSLLDAKQPVQAENAFREILTTTPSHSGALLGLIRSLIYQGRAEESQDLLERFPASYEYKSAEILRPLVTVLVNENLDVFPEDPIEASYVNSLRLLHKGKLEAAMDGLLDVLRQDKRFRNGEARKMIVAAFEVIGENDPAIRDYRAELASILF